MNFSTTHFLPGHMNRSAQIRPGSYFEKYWSSFPFRPEASLQISFHRSAGVKPWRSSAPEVSCSADMLVLIRWQGRKLAVPLSQLASIDVDQSTADAIGDWHYWVAQGYLF
jgi:Calcium binding